jgi:hypothetical protein
MKEINAKRTKDLLKGEAVKNDPIFMDFVFIDGLNERSVCSLRRFRPFAQN